MRNLLVHILLIQALLLYVSCEKDFVYDEDCTKDKDAGYIGGWDEPQDTVIKDQPDTTSGGFVIDVNNWGDTIRIEIHL